MTLTLFNPLVRKSIQCPLCSGPKPIGLIACWPCYRKEELKYGNAVAEQIIAAREGELQQERMRTVGCPISHWSQAMRYTR
jgi:hypothetical protein